MQVLPSTQGSRDIGNGATAAGNRWRRGGTRVRRAWALTGAQVRRGKGVGDVRSGVGVVTCGRVVGAFCW
jgi:hypothetical protein